MEQARVIEFSDESRHDLELCFAGISQCEPQHSYGPAVRPNYLIHIVLKGKGQFSSGNASYALEAGQGFLIQPDKVT
ncbi:AraC family ligand binding domain-containing protein, partial [Faecalibaculum rodentium]